MSHEEPADGDLVAGAPKIPVPDEVAPTSTRTQRSPRPPSFLNVQMPPSATSTQAASIFGGPPLEPKPSVAQPASAKMGQRRRIRRGRLRS